MTVFFVICMSFDINYIDMNQYDYFSKTYIYPLLCNKIYHPPLNIRCNHHCDIFAMFFPYNPTFSSSPCLCKTPFQISRRFDSHSIQFP